MNLPVTELSPAKVPPSLAAFFERLGRDVESRWRARNFDEDVFPGLAREGLLEYAAEYQATPADVIDWIVSAEVLPEQPNLGVGFGEPPLTVFATSRFYIEVLFWVDGTTNIHQHGFSGAFQVLSGKSIHSQFAFAPRRGLSSNLLLGELQFKSSELLIVGDCREIRAGDKLIHSLFHLDRPSCTIVIRTRESPATTPQYTYRRPSVAFNPFFKDPLLVRQRQMVTLLGSIDPARRAQVAATLVDQIDLASAFYLIDGFFRETPNQTAELDALLARLARRDADLAETLKPIFQESIREQSIITLRRTVHRPEHRFFLATLLNLPTKNEVFRVIQACYPDASPSEKILQWLEELSHPIGDSENPLGFEFGDGELAVLRIQLEGADDAEVFRRIRAEYESVEASEDEIKELCAGLRAALLLKPLFS